jgi:hypothetical protein
MRRSRWLLAAAAIVGVGLSPLLGVKPVLAVTNTYQFETGTSCTPWSTDGPGGDYGAGNYACYTFTSGSVFTKAFSEADGAYTITVKGYGAAAGQYRLDGGTWVSFPSIGSSAIGTLFTTESLASGAHSLETKPVNGAGLFLDYAQTDVTVATTTTTTSSTTTTTTAATTTTTTAPTTTTTTAAPGTWSPVASATRSTACSWEWGGVVEATPQRCDDVGEVTLPVWLLLAAGFGVCLGAAGLVVRFR